MWVVYKDVYKNKKGDKLISRDIIQGFNTKEHAEELLEKLLNENIIENVDYTIDQVNTIL
ncbi:hypothetical protein TEPIDINF_002733 [Tepidibacillus infernus]|uniref:Uncharacterized protein n=1 Tax=Tepidibacillus decaturensis TaxID=1413211 RepID=A0A135L1K4_9BACI|nr:hypothetical protein [Tepidibacillus decaturensis]KXG42759.1 hypothetical protein U473_00885 [Tepidibacillus decaturensis]